MHVWSQYAAGSRLGHPINWYRFPPGEARNIVVQSLTHGQRFFGSAPGARPSLF